MPTATLRYKGHQLRAYAHRMFLPHLDPYASGTLRYESVVRIDTIPSGDGTCRRYQTDFNGADPGTTSDALELAMQYARDIVDGKVQAAIL